MQQWTMLAILMLMTATAEGKERLELHVPDTGASPPPPITAWWQVNQVKTNEDAQEVVIELVGMDPMRRVCTFNGVDAERLIRDLNAPGPTSRDRRAFEAAMRPGQDGRACIGRGVVNGTP